LAQAGSPLPVLDAPSSEPKFLNLHQHKDVFEASPIILSVELTVAQNGQAGDGSNISTGFVQEETLKRGLQQESGAYH
jgi:hypothetical protein